MKTKHLLSEDSDWKVYAEFAYPHGKILAREGELYVKFFPDHIERWYWYMEGEEKIEALFTIVSTTIDAFDYYSDGIKNLGMQNGTMHVDRNRIYSKFIVENTLLNGFEIAIHNGESCHVNGAIYHDKKLIKAWTSILTRLKHE